MTDSPERRLALSLLLLRLSLALVFAAWALDKFLNPSHGASVLEGFYGVGGVPVSAIHALGAAQALLVLAFALGVARTWSYGAVLAMHAVTTAVSWKAYLSLDGILFYAAFPMLAGLVALFLLRDEDRLFSVGRSGRSRSVPAEPAGV